MDKQVIVTNSEKETRALASQIGSMLSKGSVIALSGELGAGKTTFSQGLAKGLGVEEYVDSPTFSILKIYEGRLPLYHMDVYRLDEESMEDLGLDEYLFGDGVCLVEWPSRIDSLLPEETIAIDIEALSTGARAISIHSAKLYKGLMS
ncbi:tRNA (adenosine(37)-N6)-threonylcarbamoyltransferase complex ATPase subunit type 1 TsaE [Shimazuella kribbensis]|uniref:tRNA (adenosine(37)-N6)-threonylcarbamoyltransferase complex ATPase subunit type 1 TsaE n=1 Tax=Shimazuella kribbensis TaxID=139808 RepID=UPI000413EEEC|nr:tRNA (adenosine(37)-N6)-threonylcarbamoyltransferase complex ATPase subunit type 1 TsaE [Shimazuella kribbensis]